MSKDEPIVDPVTRGSTRPDIAQDRNRTEAGEEGARFIDYLRLLWHYKFSVAGVGALVTGLAITYALLATPVYRAQVLMAPVKHGESPGVLSGLTSQFGGLASLAGVNVGSSSDTQTAIAVLQSRAFINQFIEDNDLLPVLFRERWNAESGSWDVEDPEEIPTMWRAYRRFKEIMDVYKDENTGLVTVVVEWRDPQIAANWANSLVERVNSTMRAEAVEETKRHLEYLEGQLAQTNVLELRQSLFGLIEGETKKAMLANVEGEYAFRVIDPAVPAEQRSKPNRRLIAVLGAVLGGILGVGLALFRNYLRVVRLEDEERQARV